MVSKMAWGIGWTFIIRSPNSLKIVHWRALFVQSIYCFSRKFQRNYLSWHCLNENWLDWVEKWHKQFGQFSFEQLSVPKFALWFDLLGQSIQIFRWKSTEELLMTLKSDAKFEEKLILCSKNDMRNLVNFNLSSGKDLKCVLWWANFVESI